MNQANHYSEGKPRVDLVPPEFVMAMGEVFGYGAEKYEDNGWRKGTNWHEYYGSAMRHLLLWWGGEDLDKESGLHHLAHAGVNIAILLNYTKTHKEFDDR